MTNKYVVYAHPDQLEEERGRINCILEAKLGKKPKWKPVGDPEYYQTWIGCLCGKCDKHRLKLKGSKEVPEGYSRTIINDQPGFKEERLETAEELNEIIRIFKARRREYERKKNTNDILSRLLSRT